LNYKKGCSLFVEALLGLKMFLKMTDVEWIENFRMNKVTFWS